jgi:hypothetical protein
VAKPLPPKKLVRGHPKTSRTISLKLNEKKWMKQTATITHYLVSHRAKLSPLGYWKCLSTIVPIEPVRYGVADSRDVLSNTWWTAFPAIGERSLHFSLSKLLSSRKILVPKCFSTSGSEMLV